MLLEVSNPSYRSNTLVLPALTRATGIAEPGPRCARFSRVVTDLHPERETHGAAPPRVPGPRRLRPGPRLHGHVRFLWRARRQPVRRHHPSSDRAGHHPPRIG